MPLLLVVGMLSVDVGQLHYQQSVAQTTADGMARYAVGGLRDGSWSSRGSDAAATSDLTASDYTLTRGVWDDESKSFTEWVDGDAGSPNALRVQVNVVAELLFASTAGATTTTVYSEATACYSSLDPKGAAGFGLIGLDSINTSGVVSVGSYDSAADPSFASTSPASSAGTGEAIVGTNGFINSNGTTIYGDVHMHDGQTITANQSSTGTRETLEDSLTLPNESVPSGAIAMGNINVSSGTYNVPGGIYTVSSLSIGSSAEITCTGPVTIYLTGGASIHGTVNTFQNLPDNLRIVQTTSAGIDLKSTGHHEKFVADVYNPNGPVNINGRVYFYGSVKAKTVSISGDIGIYMDTADGGYAGGAEAPGVQLVR